MDDSEQPKNESAVPLGLREQFFRYAFICFCWACVGGYGCPVFSRISKTSPIVVRKNKGTRRTGNGVIPSPLTELRAACLFQTEPSVRCVMYCAHLEWWPDMMHCCSFCLSSLLVRGSKRWSLIDRWVSTQRQVTSYFFVRRDHGL